MTRLIAAQYELRTRIGSGNMGEVWRGHDTLLDRPVAIKVLKPDLASDAVAFERFRKEAVALAKLQHPNIAGVYNFVKDGDQWCLIMELVEGVGLDAKLRQLGRMDWQRAVRITGQVLDALVQVHRIGLVHRDIKTSNLIIDPNDHVKLLDFGITRSKGQERLTRQGLWIGTLEYASPEQLKGQEADARSDLYSLACVLYELIAGQVPFAADTDYELIRAHVELPPPDLTALNLAVPRPLAMLVVKGMAKDPGSRYQSAEQFQMALDQMPTGTATGAPLIEQVKDEVLHMKDTLSAKITASRSLARGPLSSFSLSVGRLSMVVASVAVTAGITLFWLSHRETSPSAPPAPPGDGPPQVTVAPRGGDDPLASTQPTSAAARGGPQSVAPDEPLAEPVASPRLNGPSDEEMEPVRPTQSSDAAAKPKPSRGIAKNGWAVK